MKISLFLYSEVRGCPLFKGCQRLSVVLYPEVALYPFPCKGFPLSGVAPYSKVFLTEVALYSEVALLSELILYSEAPLNHNYTVTLTGFCCDLYNSCCPYLDACPCLWNRHETSSSRPYRGGHASCRGPCYGFSSQDCGHDLDPCHASFLSPHS